MDARQIQLMRALLAERPSTGEPQAISLPIKLSRLLLARPTPRETRAAAQAPANITEVFSASLDTVADPGACDLAASSESIIPFELLLGGLAPRRTAFGQRVEPVLDLLDQAPSLSRRLILMQPDGAAVGELMLGPLPPEAPKAPGRFAARLCEVPYFPDDLADHPSKVDQPAVEPWAAGGELAAIFLLAKLAARLAGEQSALDQTRARVMEAQGSSPNDLIQSPCK